MFNKPIYTSTLTSEVANRLFSNITASRDLDQTFLSTLRALLQKRLPKEETLKFSCKGMHAYEAEFIDMTAEQQLNYLIPESIRRLPESEYGVHIIYTPKPNVGSMAQDVLKANLNIVKRLLPGYNPRDDLQVFYARKAKSLFYTDATGRKTIIFTGSLELKHFHVLQMMIPKYLPHLFTDSSLTETEITLLKSLGNKSAVEYEMLIESYAKDLDIRLEIIRSKLKGFETQFERIRLNEIQDEIKVYQAEYDSYLTLMRDASNKMQECKYILAGLECSISGQSEDSELMEYFICNKNLTITSVSGTAIEFVAHGYVDIYDPSAFEQYVSNHRGYMYANLNSAVSKPQMEMLYRAIFGENKYKLRICAAYRADMRVGLRACKDYSFPLESQTYLTNPHIQQFGCIGTYAGRFQEYMQRKDYVGAIDQAVVSARNLNFYDSSVIPTFARDLSHTSIKCIEKSDGTLLTPREAIAELEGA